MLPTKDEMRARFWVLKGAIDAAEAKLEPLRVQQGELKAAEAVLIADLKAIEADVLDGMSMFDAKQELAFYARGLGNVGDDPALAQAPAPAEGVAPQDDSPSAEPVAEPAPGA